MLPLSEKVNILNLVWKEKELYANVSNIYGKNKSIREVVKKEKEISASFAVAHQTAKVTATMSDKWLVKAGKVLNLYNMIL